MANILFLGTLTIDEKTVRIVHPGSELEAHTPVLRDTVQGHEISWVIVDNKLIAQRCALKEVRFNDLERIGLANPQKIHLDGRDFILRLPRVGTAPDDLPNEWDSALDATNNRDLLWYWSEMRFWGSDQFDGIRGYRATRGQTSARGWSWEMEDEGSGMGWRPVLEPVPVPLGQALIGKRMAVWGGQEILEGRLMSYSDYDLCLSDLARHRPRKRGSWAAKAADGITVVDRSKVCVIQLAKGDG